MKDVAVLSIEGDSLQIVKESLEHELALLQSKRSYLQSEISRFETEYRMSSEIFLEKFDSGALGDDQDYFEWWGLLEGMKTTDRKLEMARGVLNSC